ncbi:MAG TPA: response regulator [Blastocatellia bacterium]|nr:response regulator [Blastocatellia bacterium]
MTKRKSILLVDDDHAVTDYLQLKLGKVYDVLATNEPRAALAMARKEQPDLILCDIDMPDMGGGDVCRSLSDDEQTRHIPVLYLTSMVSRREVQVMGGQVGGRPGVSKQAPIDEILTRIRVAIGE